MRITETNPVPPESNTSLSKNKEKHLFRVETQWFTKLVLLATAFFTLGTIFTNARYASLFKSVFFYKKIAVLQDPSTDKISNLFCKVLPGITYTLLDPQKVNKTHKLLLDASAAGDLSRVKDLVDSGIRVHESRPTGKTPLMVASEGGHKDVTSFLMRQMNPKEKAEALNTILPCCFTTPLMTAASHGRSNIVQLLLEQGADPYTLEEGDKRRMAFAFAGMKGHTHVMHLLLKKMGERDLIFSDTIYSLEYLVREGRLNEIALFMDEEVGKRLLKKEPNLVKRLASVAGEAGQWKLFHFLLQKLDLKEQSSLLQQFQPQSCTDPQK